MTAQPRQHRDREPGPADSPRRTSGAAARRQHRRARRRAGRHSHGGWLACSVHEAARLTGLSRDLLDDQMRLSNLAYVKAGRWRLITCQHLQQFPGIAS